MKRFRNSYGSISSRIRSIRNFKLVAEWSFSIYFPLDEKKAQNAMKEKFIASKKRKTTKAERGEIIFCLESSIRNMKCDHVAP